MKQFAAKVKGSIVRNFEEEPILTIAVGLVILSAVAMAITVALILTIGGVSIFYPVVFLYGLSTLAFRVGVVLLALAFIEGLIDMKINEALDEAGL